ncbi:MAG TPA: ComF family protein [Calditrichaeota bacterium]|nr:ComF family protein [Calditrichota bacterium]
MNPFFKFLNPLISLFIPPSCIFCGEELPSDRRGICAPCYDKLPVLSENFLQVLNDEITPCHYDTLFVAFEFNKEIQTMVHLLKYKRYLTFAEYFAHSISREITKPIYDLVTAVPLNPIRYRERGYNQSALIAKSIANILSVPFENDILERVRPTISQTNLNREARKLNVKNAFHLLKKPQGKRVLLVDDVITTGSTLNECAKVIRKGDALLVDIAAVATPANILQHKLEEESDFLIL